MIHPGLAALEKWDTIEYAAGYRARLAAIPDSEIAHHCWRCGWTNGVPFDEGRTQPWKEGWIAADINVGLAGFED
jgi:hypothetical protein